MKDTIIKEHFYAFPIEMVWEAITDEQQINEWFINADFRAEEGYKYTFTHEETKVTGEVLNVEPTTKLVYTWIVGDTTEETTVEWSLKAEKGGTLLTIKHSGFSKYSADMATSMFTSSVQGWDAVFNELEKFLK